MSTRAAEFPAHLSSDDVSANDRALLEEFITASAPDSSVALLLQRILSSVSRGADINVFDDDAELTPNQAAELLKMSRPHLVKFMDRGDLSFHRVGSHRRVVMSDLMEFAAAREEGSRIVAEALGGQEVSEVAQIELTAQELEELGSL